MKQAKMGTAIAGAVVVFVACGDGAGMVSDAMTGAADAFRDAATALDDAGRAARDASSDAQAMDAEATSDGSARDADPEPDAGPPRAVLTAACAPETFEVIGRDADGTIVSHQRQTVWQARLPAPSGDVVAVKVCGLVEENSPFYRCPADSAAIDYTCSGAVPQLDCQWTNQVQSDAAELVVNCGSEIEFPLTPTSNYAIYRTTATVVIEG